MAIGREHIRASLLQPLVRGRNKNAGHLLERKDRDIEAKLPRLVWKKPAFLDIFVGLEYVSFDVKTQETDISHFALIPRDRETFDRTKLVLRQAGPTYGRSTITLLRSYDYLIFHISRFIAYRIPSVARR